MAREPTYGSTATHPHTGGQHGRSLTSNVTPTPMKLKNYSSFGPPQGGPLLLMSLGKIYYHLIILRG